MKKRDVFWLNRIVFLLLVIIIFIIVSLYNMVQFNKSYIQEEKAEMEIFRKQIEWVIKPLIENNEISKIQLYANDFSDDYEFYFKIFDTNKKLIATSKKESINEISQNDKRVTLNKYNVWDLYRHSFHDKNLEKVSEFQVNGKRYYLELSLSQEFVIRAIIKAQRKIIVFSYACLVFLIFGLIHIFYPVRKAFNKLEDSVIEISRGKIETEIDIPKLGILTELSTAIKHMTNRLRLQIDRLKKLEEYRTEFISNLSHEIKTPITAINSAVEFLQESSESAGINKECLDIINFQTDALNKLVTDVLSLSETELEKTRYNKSFKKESLRKIINKSIENQGIVNCEFKIIGETNKTLLCEGDLAITLFTNIISNAVKYSGSQLIEIQVTENIKTLDISIKDYGIGIKKDDLSRIFERFYRVDKARSRNSGGNGLGLAIVKSIAELHNWKISAESEVNRYTIFKISVPKNEIS